MDFVVWERYYFCEISKEWMEIEECMPVPRSRIHLYQNYACKIIRGGSRKYTLAFNDDAPRGRMLSPAQARANELLAFA